MRSVDASMSGDSVSNRSSSYDNNQQKWNQDCCPPIKRVKLVFVGDAAIGKTSLIVSYTTNGYPQEYVPTAFDNYSVQVRVDDTPVSLQLCDTAGQNEFDTLRALCYPNSDLFILCFSVISPLSFCNLQQKWLPEIRQQVPKAHCILVGTQSDLRTNIKVMLDLSRYNESPVSEHEAVNYARKIGALEYIECSALTQHNLKEVFDTAILAALGRCTERRQSKVMIQEFRGRKSFRKIKDKITRSSSTNNAHTSQKRFNYRSFSNGRMTKSITNRELTDCQTNCNGHKYSTNSAPASGIYSGSLILPVENNKTKCGDKGPNKLKKGWRKLLCMA